MKNIIFDMGGVLPATHINDYIDRYSDDPEARIFLKKQVIQSVESVMIDRGTMTDEEAIASICSRVDEKWHTMVKDFLTNFRQYPDPNPPMKDLVNRLKAAGYKLYLFSNVGYRYKLFFPYLDPNPLSEMDGGAWTSCDYKVIKPEKEAYESMFKLFKLDPSECFFIDDTPANIEQGIRLGMDGCVYRGNITELEQNLKRAGFIF